MQNDKNRLKITEVFLSLQGEANSVGWPTIFIRLTGCPLRCSYCDSEYAFTGGQWHSFEQLLTQIASYKIKRICVTGGEPLSQKKVLPFLKLLCDNNYEVSLETSGALSVAEVDKRVIKVVDIKTPSSNESKKNDLTNLDYLKQQDQLKFLIADNADYDWSVAFIKQHQCLTKCTVLFSPIYKKMSEVTLANKIVNDQLDVRFQMQLHKFLWGEKEGV